MIILVAILLGNAFIEKEQKNKISTIEKDEDVIRTYLNEKTDDIVSSDDGKCFSAFEILGARKDKVYLLVLKYNESGGASYTPVVLKFDINADNFSIISHKIPRDGAYFSDDVKKLFPMRLRNKAFRIDRESEIRLKNLEKQIEKMRRTACSPHFFYLFIRNEMLEKT
ncbi:hypothetical protein JGS6364_06981 [[Clostridium] sordellii]|uniref:hypothetical protein n=1 Tax=Paraclostridium sordellii TaxID=1505 RepID=UPI00054195B3|nr:hypothetical protein [Paeniclostridium sordellii]CEK30052.1 hypothetical protein JGS6364_06981 [[Clostridium] sordellii] [Paeniclostridium sordellii]